MYRLSSANLTRYARTAAGAFTETTVLGVIVAQGSNQNSFPLANQAKFANTLFTPNPCYEGDRYMDQFEVMYDVHHVIPINVLNQNDHLQAELFKLTTATLRTLTLGDYDTYTGWPSLSYAESTIYINIAFKGMSQIRMPMGVHTRGDYVGVTATAVLEGDQIAYHGVTYEVVSSYTVPSSRTDFSFAWTVVGLTKRDYATHPATSGSWHLNSQSLETDPRYKTKKLIDDYIEELSGDVHVCLGGPQFNIKRWFTTAGLEGVAAVTRKPSTAIYDYAKKPYCFNEQMQIDLYSVDKTTVTGTNFNEAFEQAIRMVLTTWATSTTGNAPVRNIQSITADDIDIGAGTIYHTALTYNFKRWNDDYAGSNVTLTWGPSASPTGTYTIPTITYLSPLSKVNTARLMPPGRIGSITQKLGMPDAFFTMKLDVDFEPPTPTMRRPQTTTPKTDVLPWQTLYDIQFNGQIDQAYQTLNLGWGGTVQVTLEDVQPEQTPEGTMVNLTFYTYNSASGSAYKTWWGISP